MITKIALSLITTFLFIVSLYLIISKKKISGSYYDGNGWGWVHNSFTGYFLLIVAIGFLVGLIFVFKKKKIKL